MEVLNDEKVGATTPKNTLPSSLYLFAGILMIVCGLVWLMNNYNIVGPAFMDAFFSWQMFVVAVGGWLLCARQWTFGGVVTGMGVTHCFIVARNIPSVIFPRGICRLRKNVRNAAICFSTAEAKKA